jgi:hypothetical protein
MALNVLAVTDVFAVAIKELRSNSSNRKNVAEQNRAEGDSPNTVLCSPSRRKAASCPQSGQAHIQTCYTMIFLPTLTTAVVHGRTTAWNKFFILLLQQLFYYIIYTIIF